MQITINSITRPGSCDHYLAAVTINGNDRVVIITKQQFLDNPEGKEEEVLQRLRTYCKENSLSTFSAIKTNLEGKTFQL